jgi:hypothetical protein
MPVGHGEIPKDIAAGCCAVLCWQEPSACGTCPVGQHDSPDLPSWPSGHPGADAKPLAGWQVPSGCGLDDTGQHVPEDVSCESAHDAATPPPGSWQVSSPVGVEPGVQQASPSAVVGPGHIGAAFAGSMLALPAPTIVIVAAIAIRTAARTLRRGPQAAAKRVRRHASGRPRRTRELRLVQRNSTPPLPTLVSPIPMGAAAVMAATVAG